MADQTSSAHTTMATFNADAQLFDLHDRYGVEFAASMADLKHFIHDNTSTASIYALQIGASVAVLIMLIILTKPDKRRSPVFMLNSLALLFNIIATSLLCVYWLGPWRDVLNYLSTDYSTVPDSAIAQSITSTLFVLAVIICLEASLVLQVHVVSITLPQLRRNAILGLSALVAGVAIVTYIVQTAFRIKINQLDRSTNPAIESLTQAKDITLAISICFFSLVFCLKLGWSMYRRHRLGIHQFGPMQIILIGGTQTMIIPVIFIILQFAYPRSRASSLVTTLTALSLPLTALWASAATDAASASSLRQAAALGGNAFASGPTPVGSGSAGSGPASPVKDEIVATERFSVSSNKEGGDVEMQGLGWGTEKRNGW